MVYHILYVLFFKILKEIYRVLYLKKVDFSLVVNSKIL